MLLVDSLALRSFEKSLWENCLDPLRSSLGEGSFCTWIETLQYIGCDQGILSLGAMNELSRSWVEKHYANAILESARAVDSTIKEIRVQVVGLSCRSKALEIGAKELVEVRPASQRITTRLDLRANDQLRHKQLGQFYADYRFETFVVGECNRMAYTVARTVADAPGDNHYNPLVVYGRSGLGKTHLLQAIGRFAVEQETAQKVLYCSAEKFLKDFIRIAVQERKSDEFYGIYEAADILILDDIQFLVGKERTQEELFKIFNRLLAKKKQIVLSCDQLPSEVAGLDKRLLNRFESGLCCSLNPMDLQTRLDFLHAKSSSEGYGLTLSEDSFRWLATHFRSNVRELEGVLVKLLGLREIMNMELTLDNIQRMVGEVVKAKSKSISMTSIAESTALAFGIKADLLSAKSRVQTIALPRKVAIRLCRDLTDHSLEAIGFQFNRDYSTVIASLKAIDEMIDSDPLLRDKVEGIRQALLS